MSEGQAPQILCFGEVLWDALPRGLFPGGAPLNVAYHLRKFGMRPLLVTAVGRDRLGDELLRRLESWGIDTRGVVVDADRGTGLSRVALLEGNPEFEIAPDVAWDRIELSPAVLAEAASSAAVVFGSLAQRSAHNRSRLAALLERCPAGLKVFDVNLRPPFDGADVVWDLARQADLVKLNQRELEILLGRPSTVTGLPDAARRFSELAGVRYVCVTAGSRGAGLLTEGRWFWQPTREIPVRDSVGAGDAFLAALLFGQLRGDESPERILRRAGRLAKFIVTQDGATPAYRLDTEGNVLS